jgi:glycosyltransferase involved in cell wall biosynthesis
MNKVSVLVAVYNAERYLRKCLDSLVSQTLRDIQIVCINDCSSDSSAMILDEYARKDDRIVVLAMNENSGQAVARNKGLEVADGEFITMLDSDDWFEPDSLEKAYKTAIEGDGADCVLFRLMQCFDDGRVEEYRNRTDKTSFSGEEAFRLCLDWSLHGLYMVRSDIHKSYPYDTSCRLYSDDNTTRLHYLHSQRVAISDGCYCYRKHPESMTSSCSILRFDYLDANLSMKETLLKEIELGYVSDADEVLNFYERHRWLNLVDAYWYYWTNRERFTGAECALIEKRIAAILQTIESKRIAPSLKCKLGYYPFKSYKVFSLVENFYFSLRRFLFRI